MIKHRVFRDHLLSLATFFPNAHVNGRPDGHIVIRGDLSLCDTGITGLPDHLTIDGTLNLTGLSIQELPDHLTVTHSLHLDDTPIRVLPETLSVGQDLFIRGGCL